MQARFYLPQYHRFSAPDPARDQHFEATQSWNIYSYVQNNPLNKTDPTGMMAFLNMMEKAALQENASLGSLTGGSAPSAGGQNPASTASSDSSGDGKAQSGTEVDLAGKPGATGSGVQPTTNGTVQNWTTDAPSPAATPGVFTVVVHGAPGADHGATSQSNGTSVPVADIAAAVKGSPEYKAGMPVRMVSCFAGAGQVDSNGQIAALPLAQRLANTLNTSVQASPFRITESTQNGQVVSIQERSPQGMRAVQWQTYSPGQMPPIRSIIPFM